MDQQTIADYPVGGAATTPTFRYVFASYIDEPVVRKTAGTGGTLFYFHRNHQYSITAVTVLVQREMDFCLIGVNRKWVTVTNLF
jgi:hypothetical protein